MKCECDERVMTLRDEALLLSNGEFASERADSIRIQISNGDLGVMYKVYQTISGFEPATSQTWSEHLTTELPSRLITQDR